VHISVSLASSLPSEPVRLSVTLQNSLLGRLDIVAQCDKRSKDGHGVTETRPPFISIAAHSTKQIPTKK